MKKKLTKRDVSEIIKVLEKVKKVDLVALNKSLQATLDNMLERLKTNTFRLAVVGEFSSGKSTFLNAIIGKDILKHGVQETTASFQQLYQKLDNTNSFLENIVEVIEDEENTIKNENGKISKLG